MAVYVSIRDFFSFNNDGKRKANKKKLKTRKRPRQNLKKR